MIASLRLLPLVLLLHHIEGVCRPVVPWQRKAVQAASQSLIDAIQAQDPAVDAARLTAERETELQHLRAARHRIDDPTEATGYRPSSPRPVLGAPNPPADLADQLRAHQEHR
ncbi:hypothetical protein PSD17_25710 [Pseudonocardia sp. D17]|nr:hypothetical protein PSD17_25710 [Pseudonocardia sp. D17]